jgi:hypothetical protein
MAAVPKNLKFLLFGRGPKFHGTVAIVLEMLGLACLIVGIVAGVTNKELGMISTEWFLVVIAIWIWSLWSWLTAYVAAKD